jgi:aspartate/glutamate racemase
MELQVVGFGCKKIRSGNFLLALSNTISYMSDKIATSYQLLTLILAILSAMVNNSSKTGAISFVLLANLSAMADRFYKVPIDGRK